MLEEIIIFDSNLKEIILPIKSKVISIKSDSIIKFNNLELTFSKLPSRPRLEQWFMGIY